MREWAASASTLHNYAGALYELTIAEAGNVSNKTVYLKAKTNGEEAIFLMDDRWKKTVFSRALMDMIGMTECKCRRIDFSNYIRLEATAAMKQNSKSSGAGASTGHTQ